MRFCPFCTAENTLEATHCGACGRRLPPVPQRRQRTATNPGAAATGGPPRVGTAPIGSGPGVASGGVPASTAAPEPSGGRRSLLAALSPSPAAERRPAPPPEPRGAGVDARRRNDFTDTAATTVDDRGNPTLPSMPSMPGDDTATNIMAAPPVAPSRRPERPDDRTEAPAPPSQAPPPQDAAEPRRSKTTSNPPPLPPRRKAASIPPPVPDRSPGSAALPHAQSGPTAAPGQPADASQSAPQVASAALPAPARKKRPSMQPPLYPMQREAPQPLPAAPSRSPARPVIGTEAPASPSQAAPGSARPPLSPPGVPVPPATSPASGPTTAASGPMSAPIAPGAPPAPGAPFIPGDGFTPLPTPARRQLEAFEPPPTRIMRGEGLGSDRPFAPPRVIPIPEIPEPGLIPAARYAITFLRARYQRRGAIKSLAEDIKRDTDALDQILGSLGRTARSVKLEGRVFATENAAIDAAETKLAQVAQDGVEILARKTDENSKYGDVENDRTTRVSQGEHGLGEAQRELQHLEGQRRGLRDKRKDIERRQKLYLKNAEAKDEEVANAPMGEARMGMRSEAEKSRREAAQLEPERQEIDRKLAVLEKPIADATAKVDAAKAELESARRSLDDAREGHGHRLAELESEQKRKAKETQQAEAEIVRRMVTLGTLLNLNRVDRPEFTELYLRVDRLRTAIGARTTEQDKLTAERDAYDKASLIRGLATMGGAVLFLITLIVLLRACL